jgi:hypothetical protein
MLSWVTIGPQRIFEQPAASGGSEPILPEVARRPNVGFLSHFEILWTEMRFAD